MKPRSACDFKRENVWAVAAVHAIGRVNFLDDPSQLPHCKPKIIYEFFGIGESTGQQIQGNPRSSQDGTHVAGMDLAQSTRGKSLGVDAAGQRFDGRYSANAHRIAAEGL